MATLMPEASHLRSPKPRTYPSHLPLTPILAPLPSVQDAGDMGEMRAMFREIKTLTKKNSAYVEMLAKAEEL